MAHGRVRGAYGNPDGSAPAWTFVACVAQRVHPSHGGLRPSGCARGRCAKRRAEGSVAAGRWQWIRAPVLTGPRVALLSLQAHADRSYLDDRPIAVLCGALRASGLHADVVAGVLETPGDEARLAEVLSGYDVALYERLWDGAIVERLRARVPALRFVALEGEHGALDGPADAVARAPLAETVPRLIAFWERPQGTAPPGTRVRHDGRWHDGGPWLRRVAQGTEPTPVLERIAFNPERTRAPRTFSIPGRGGCPYQADARSAPAYEGVEMPAGIGRGCGFCTTGNHYAWSPPAEVVARLIDELRAIRDRAPDIERIVLKDQNPFDYLDELVDRCVAEGLGSFSLLLESRADWLLRNRTRLERALETSLRGGPRLSLYLVGIENFSDAELARMNKGLTARTNEAFLAMLWEMKARWGQALDLENASFGFILLTPWTTLDDLRINHDAIARTRFDRLRGKILLSRLRLYPDTALYWLARKDGLLVDRWPDLRDDASRRYGYAPGAPWRYAHADVARFAAMAARETERTGGRDQLRTFGELLARVGRPQGLVIGSAPGAAPTDAVRTSGAVEVAPESDGSGAPALGRDDARQGPKRSARRSVQVHLGGSCPLRCAVCECHAAPTDEALVDRWIAQGGQRLLLTGSPEARRLEEVVARARARGFEHVVWRAPLHDASTPDRWRALRQMGLTGVRVPLHASRPAVHDRIAGAPDALVRSIVGMRAAAAAGLSVEVETPILPERLGRPVEVLELAHRAVPALALFRPYVPRRVLPVALGPPSWREVESLLGEVLDRARALGVAVTVGPTDGIPLCLFGLDETRWWAFRFDPRATARVGGCEKLAPCVDCAVRMQCAGVPQSAARMHGAAGLRPFRRRPRALYEQRTTPARRWTEPEREAARRRDLLVLRPTVHCNQDCVFCSADSTSENVWTRPERMLRAIARAAGRVRRISFSGGEPTLDPALPEYVRAARRLGIPEVEIATNAVLLDRPGKARALAEAGLTHAFVSLHAPDETLSRSLTLKRDDFDRTVAGTRALLEAGVTVVINTVVTTRNLRLLADHVAFVHRAFEGRVALSLAWMTPQFRALENITLLPRYRDGMPHVRRALYRALRLGQPVHVGSRQGVPPCQLGEFEAWSDLPFLAHEGLAEDAHQKVRAPDCDRCRWARFCTGVWKAYAARYGLDELRPLPGPPLDEEGLRALHAVARPAPFGVPRSFDEVPELLRHRELELAGEQALLPTPRADEGRTPSGEPTVFPMVGRCRPNRVLLVGSAGRARRLARAMQAVDRLALVAVASPHAPETAGDDFGGAPTFRDAIAALDEVRPDAVVVASATHTHAPIATAALERGIPALVEKPLCSGVKEAEALVQLARARRVPLWPAHAGLFAAGLERVLERARSARSLLWRRTVELASPDLPAVWAQAALYETLVHPAALVAHVFGPGPIAVRRARWVGDHRPERIEIELEEGARSATVWFERSGRDALHVEAGDASTAIVWRRIGTSVWLDDGSGERALERDRGEIERMLAAFAAHVLDDTSGEVRVEPWEGPLAMRLAGAMLDALREAGAPLDRPDAPRHASTPSLRPAGAR
ncbi:MAG: radical SAM protein [Myxococcota bacterium]|nr:radical SAM protein [Myxococcota bacterium]MDW8362376.1 radical SAM protein [Myxococcales bacterium]